MQIISSPPLRLQKENRQEKLRQYSQKENSYFNLILRAIFSSFYNYSVLFNFMYYYKRRFVLNYLGKSML